jgi:hypothetical protein
MGFMPSMDLRRTYQGRGPQQIQQNMPAAPPRYTNPNGWDNTGLGSNRPFAPREYTTSTTRRTGANSGWANTGRDASGNRISDTTFKRPADGAIAADPYGSQSGPGILESWFNQRAAGTDPAYEYAMQRGMQSLGNQSAAAGSFNSGAARQQESDFAANMAAQRLGQLDALAGGASGEHQGRVNSMFQQGQGLYGGMAGLSTAYDLGAAGNMAAANQAQTQMALNSAAQQQQAHAGFVNNLATTYGLSRMGSGPGGGGYADQYNANNPYPV